MALTELSTIVGMPLDNFQVENVRTEHQYGSTKVTIVLQEIGITHYSMTATDMSIKYIMDEDGIIHNMSQSHMDAIRDVEEMEDEDYFYLN